jgi:monoamine oxidase
MRNGRPNIARRQFLQWCGAIGGGGVVYHGLTMLGLLRIPDTYAEQYKAPEIDSQWGQGKSVIVLGAGLAGLCSAYLLANSGLQVRVIEANNRYGGRSFTIRQGDTFHEVGGPEQECTFTDKDLYFNAAPGRIPQHHCVVLDYCRRFRVRLEPYIFLCEANFLQNDQIFDGKPVPFRRVRYNLRRHISELLAKCMQQGALDKELSTIDGEKFLAMLENFGALKRKPNGEFVYKIPSDPSQGYANAGYRVQPGAASQSGEPFPGISFEDIIASGFWDTELFNHLQYDWQTSLMQPVGGMDMIWKAFLKQSVPLQSIPPDMRGEKPSTVETLMSLGSPVTAVRNTTNGVDVRHGGDVVNTADFCISTMAPIQLVQVGRDFSTAFVSALADITYTPACKLGWQTKKRFWEIDDEIYGGISWTKHIISHIWYPSSGYQGETEVLIAAYNRGNSAFEFGNYSLKKRFELALEGGREDAPWQLPAKRYLRDRARYRLATHATFPWCLARRYLRAKISVLQEAGKREARGANLPGW